MSCEVVPVLTFLAWKLPLWPSQRVLNYAWVTNLKAKQQVFINKYGASLIPGSFITNSIKSSCLLLYSDLVLKT